MSAAASAAGHTTSDSDNGSEGEYCEDVDSSVNDSAVQVRSAAASVEDQIRRKLSFSTQTPATPAARDGTGAAGLNLSPSNATPLPPHLDFSIEPKGKKSHTTNSAYLKWFKEANIDLSTTQCVVDGKERAKLNKRDTTQCTGGAL